VFLWSDMQTQVPEPKRTETAHNADCSICLTTESLHNFTSPVNQMCSLADLIVKRYEGKLDNEAETLFSFFKGSAHRLQILLVGLRTYIEVTSSTKPYQRCEGDALLAASMATIEHEITEASATVTHDRLPELICDPVQMSFVFTGLIDNSIKFRGERAPEIHVSSSSQDGVWLLTIRDNGIGIPEHQKDRVFGMFHRLNGEMIPGAGVGLTIARRVVEQHGGRIWVESAVGPGATFFLTLPKSQNC
jgi:light-regulated signal transduction histidine kinase (bacteriophytochrome)